MLVIKRIVSFKLFSVVFEKYGNNITQKIKEQEQKNMECVDELIKAFNYSDIDIKREKNAGKSKNGKKLQSGHNNKIQ